MSTRKSEKKAEEAAIGPRQRPKVTSGVTEKVTTGCGNIYVTVNSDEKGLFEVFSTLGKAGGCASAQLEATCRLIRWPCGRGWMSLMWCDNCAASAVRPLPGRKVRRCSPAPTPSPAFWKSISRAMASKPGFEDYGLAKNLGGQCPECGGLLVYQEGCFICPACGYTKC